MIIVNEFNKFVKSDNFSQMLYRLRYTGTAVQQST